MTKPNPVTPALPEPLASRGLRPVVNASGTMTSLGASRVVPEAIAAGAAIQPHFVRIDELQAHASQVIAGITGAEAGYVTACSAAGMTLGVAAAMTGPDLAAIERLPDTRGLRDEVVVPAGHLVNYGAPVDQAIRLPGARVVAAGTAAHVEAYHVAAALGERTAAGLFVVSHHVVPDGQIPLAEFIAHCHARSVPVIVDMASEQDLTGPIALGADLVVYSAHKFLGGPTAGIVAGRLALVRAAYLQNRGIGRPMKVGKEGIAGALAALEAWVGRDGAAARAREGRILAGWQVALEGAPGLRLQRQPDWTGNPIERLTVRVEPAEAGLHAWELADRLAAGTPSIQVRDDTIEHGAFHLDPCNLDEREAAAVAEAILAVCQAARAAGDGCRMGLAERRRLGLEGLLRWPG